MSVSEKSVWLFTVAAPLTIISALIYLTGWTYAYHYLAQFQLGLLQVAIPADYFVMYGFWVVRKTWVWLLIPALLVLKIGLPQLRIHIPIINTWMTAFQQKKPESVVKYWHLLLVAVVFISAWWLAKSAAENDYTTQRSQSEPFAIYPQVQLWLTEEARQGKQFQDIDAALQNGVFKLLLHNNGRLYIFKPSPANVKPAVTILKEKDVRWLRVL